MPKQKVKSIKTYALNLTLIELIHLRDLLGIILPNEGKTISKLLAQVEGRIGAEANLWKKIEGACKKNNLPLGPNAPDYTVTFAEVPDLTVVPMYVNEEVIIEEVEENA